MGKKKKGLENSRVHIISIERAGFIALLFIVPIALIYALPFYLLWGKNVFASLRFQSLLFLLLFIVLGIVIHELLHGIVWAVFSKKGFRSIHFGVKWEFFTPYCHCTESLKVWQYILGGVAPLIIMGLLPGIYAIITGNALVMFIGIFFSWAAGGDIQAVWMLRRFKINQLIHDHPEELGFIVENEKTEQK
ncbi:hypothetical protein ES705_25322 [subsurface metagenome]